MVHDRCSDSAAVDDSFASPSPRALEGPVSILCDEIDFPLDWRLERADVLVAFVAELVREIAHEHWITGKASEHGGRPPSPASASVLELAEIMLRQPTRATLIDATAAVHDAAHELNPDDAYPTNHTIDMLSSCASAIRFGLEFPGRSRHAASAAQHVWKRIYGVSRFDGRTGAWEKDFARSVLTSALIALLPPIGDGAAPVHAGASQSNGTNPEPQP